MVEVLNNLEEIIENVVKYLPSKQLNESMRVNSSWYRAAKRVKRRRISPFLMCYADKDDERRNYHEDDSFTDCFENFLNNMHSVPSMAFVFMTCKFDGKGCTIPDAESNKRRVIPFHYLESQLPASCQFVYIKSFGIIATNLNSKIEEYSRNSATAMLFFPEREDLVIRVFKYSKNLNRDLEIRDADEDERKKYEGKSLKLLLLFFSHGTRNKPEKMVLRHKCLVAGSYVTSARYKEPRCSDFAIAFYGKPNIEVASVIVPYKCYTRKNVEGKLKEFLPFLMTKFEGESSESTGNKHSNGQRPSFDVRKYSHRIYGMVFGCVGRDTDFFNNQPNLDSEAFATVLPGVPLIGVHGDGEIGMEGTSFSLLQESSGCREGLNLGSCLHTYSSVFVLLTF